MSRSDQRRQVASPEVLASLTDEERENAAVLCSCRASDEASGKLIIGDRRRRTGVDGFVFDPAHWTANECKLAITAFHFAANRIGCGIGRAPILWAEAEAMIRTGFARA